MNPINDEIINSLRNNKPLRFEELLSKLGVSDNTLRLHLDTVAERGEVKKEKRPLKGRGRPGYVYSMVSGPLRRSSPRMNQVTGVVSLSFERLSQVCRFEKGEWCKNIKGWCYASDCPQIR